MEVVHTFAVIAAIIGLGFLSELIFKKTKIPDVLLLIGMGILIGPVLGWVMPEQLVGATLFTTFALIFLLFQGALNINVHEMIATLSPAVRLTVYGFLLASGVVTLVAMLFGYDILTSLLLGMMLGGTASAVVVPMVHHIRMENSTRIVLILESALTDVLCIVGAITVMNIMSSGSVGPGVIFDSMVLSFSIAVAVGGLLGLLWIILLQEFEHLTHAYMVTIAVVIGTYALVEGALAANGAIAALAFGLVLGNANQFLRRLFKYSITYKARYTTKGDVSVVRDVLSPSARTFYSEISFFVKVFFFVYIGILMDFTRPETYAIATLLTLAVFLVRPLAVRATYGKRMPWKERALLEVMNPKGLAPIVLLQLAIQENIPGAQALTLPVLLTVLFTILLTALLVFLVHHGLFRGFWIPWKRR